MNIAATIPLPDDHVVHVLVDAFKSAYGEFSRAGRDDYDRECSPLVRALARIPARTQEGLRAKGEVVCNRLGGETMAEMVEEGAGDDIALLLSFAADALALGEGGRLAA
jgi:hypothetical protein